MLLQGEREAVLRAVRAYPLHTETYYEVHYTLADAPDGPVHGARLSHDAMAADLRPGDRVRLHFVLNMLVKMEPAADASGQGSERCPRK
jgi:hypothetical protein